MRGVRILRVVQGIPVHQSRSKTPKNKSGAGLSRTSTRRFEGAFKVEGVVGNPDLSEVKSAQILKPSGVGAEGQTITSTEIKRPMPLFG